MTAMTSYGSFGCEEKEAESPDPIPDNVEKALASMMSDRCKTNRQTLIFNPNKESFDSETYSDVDIYTDTHFKIGYAVTLTVIFFGFSFMAGRITLNCGLALGLLLVFTPFVMIWVKILIQSPNIYAISLPTAIIPDWIQVSIPSPFHPIKMRKNRVVTSISELSGVRGAHMMILLRISSAAGAMVLLTGITIDLHHRKRQFLDIESGADMVPVCLLIQTLGLFYTGHFELNLHDGVHTFGHFVGVAGIMIGSSGIGFVLEWDILSKTLVGLEVTAGITYAVYSARCVKKSDDIRVVTRTSKICIAIELVMFVITISIAVLCLYASGENEGNLYASPFLDYQTVGDCCVEQEKKSLNFMKLFTTKS